MDVRSFVNQKPAPSLKRRWPEVDSLRSRTMASVKQKDTKPELTVRKLLHHLGYRFRLHGKDLPGRPDIVFRGRKMAIFVHGCFWHGHDCKHGRRQPRTNQPYWLSKISRNRVRDTESAAKLGALGWSVLTVWECELKEMKKVVDELVNFLGTRRVS